MRLRFQLDSLNRREREHRSTVIAEFRHPTAGKLAYAALAFGMGLVLGVAYDRLGIAASMGIHFAFDTVTLILIRPLLPIREPRRRSLA